MFQASSIKMRSAGDGQRQCPVTDSPTNERRVPSGRYDHADADQKIEEQKLYANSRYPSQKPFREFDRPARSAESKNKDPAAHAYVRLRECEEHLARDQCKGKEH